MNRLLLLTPLFAALALPAAAQTILSVSATGTASAEPDEAIANFEIQATNPQAAAAQAEVNQAVAKALAQAKGVSGVMVSTGSYNTYSTMPDHQTKPEFTAQQSLTLIQPATGGVPDAAFSALLGKLQADGLLLTGLSGGLSASGTNKLRTEATHNALVQLRSDASNIADTLHKKVGALQTLNVDTNGGNVPPIGPRFMAMAASAPPPQSAPEHINVSVRVSAKIDLDPAS